MASHPHGSPVADPRLDVPAPPWSYNPSAWNQRVRVCMLAGLGFLIATYLALYQWGLIDRAWDPFFGGATMRVLDSDVSHAMRRWIGVPDAALGAIAYLGDLIYGLAGSTRRWQYRPWMVVLFGIDVIPLGIVSAVLVVLQATVVGSWCFPCILSAVISLALVALAYDEVWSCLRYLARLRARGADRRLLWNCFWGRRSRLAELAAFPAEASG